jgi:Uncharacterised nucleotidyltransferase
MESSKDKYLSKQDYFLLLGSRITLSAAECTTFDQLLLSVDNWNHIVQKAIASNVSPLLYKNCIKSKNKTAIPVDILAELKKIYLRTWMRNTKMNANFKTLIELFAANNIDCIPLKGVYLNVAVYGDLGLRLMSDIDVMIKESEIERAKDLMLENGWAYVKRTYRSKTHMEIDKSIAHDLYTLKKQNTLIELHNGIHRRNKSYNVTIADYWERSREGEFMGVKACFLNKTDVLLHLCLHTYGDFIAGSIKLKLFVDIAEFLKINETEIDWGLLKKRCVSYNCLGEVQIILRLCKHFFNADINLSFVDNSLTFKQNGINYEKLFLHIFQNNLFAKVFYFVYGNYRKTSKLRELNTAASVVDFIKGYWFYSEKYSFK